jgi:ABC-type Mn2+/Zn2+ transport system permease subunit
MRHAFVDPFQLEFMQRALVAGLLTVVASALVGTWVVVRGLSFMGDALAHGVLPGVALAFVAGFDLTLGALLGAVVMVAGVNLVHTRGRVSDDTAIGLLFVGMLALGVIIVSRSRSYTGDLTAFLFGDILGVDDGDVRTLLVTAVVTVVLVAVLYRPFLVLSFNEAKARTLGLRPRLAHLVMLGLIALAVVASFQAVGTLLVLGLIVAPPATATLVARRLPAIMATAVLAGAVAVYLGLLVSYHAGTAASATISGVAVGLFFVALIVREVTTRVADHRQRHLAAGRVR